LYCQELASALASNQKLETLDLDQNNLGQSGLIVILEALRDSHGPLKILRYGLYSSCEKFALKIIMSCWGLNGNTPYRDHLKAPFQ
jgi:hypothetical protein